MTNETQHLETGGVLPLQVTLDGYETWIVWGALRDLESKRPDYPAVLVNAEQRLKDKLEPVAMQFLNERSDV